MLVKHWERFHNDLEYSWSRTVISSSVGLFLALGLWTPLIPIRNQTLWPDKSIRIWNSPNPTIRPAVWSCESSGSHLRASKHPHTSCAQSGPQTHTSTARQSRDRTCVRRDWQMLLAACSCSSLASSGKIMTHTRTNLHTHRPNCSITNTWLTRFMFSWVHKHMSIEAWECGCLPFTGMQLEWSQRQPSVASRATNIQLYWMDHRLPCVLWDQGFKCFNMMSHCFPLRWEEMLIILVFVSINRQNIAPVL